MILFFIFDHGRQTRIQHLPMLGRYEGSDLIARARRPEETLSYASTLAAAHSTGDSWMSMKRFDIDLHRMQIRWPRMV